MTATNSDLSDVDFVQQITAVGRAIGSMAASLFLFHSIYCQRRAGVDVWFDVRRDAERDPTGNMIEPAARESESWEWSTGLHRRDQQCARKILKALGLLSERRGGIPARLFFLVNLSKAEKLISECRLTQRDAKENNRSSGTASNVPAGKPKQRRQSGTEEVCQQVQLEPTNNKGSSLYQNTTTVRSKHVKPDNAAIDKNIPRISLDFHPIVRAHVPAIEQALQSLKTEEAQAIVDELAGYLDAAAKGLRKPIHNVGGWLYRMTKLSAEGSFKPNAGIEIGRQRRAKQSSQPEVQESAMLNDSTQRVTGSKLSQQCIADLRQILPLRPATRSPRSARS